MSGITPGKRTKRFDRRTAAELKGCIVRLKRKITTRGGKSYPAGTLWEIVGKWNGLEIKKRSTCALCGSGEMERMREIPFDDLELLNPLQARDALARGPNPKNHRIVLKKDLYGNDVPEGIRNDDGFLVFFPTLTEFPNQNDRYVREIYDLNARAACLLKTLIDVAVLASRDLGGR